MTQRHWLALFGLLGISALCNAQLPLYHDEAYYWVWSRHLALSYFDHPPIIAYMIRAFSGLGHNAFVLRIVNLVCLFGTAAMVYATAERMFSKRTARMAMWIFLMTPIAQIELLITSPDSPLMLMWSICLYTAYRYFDTPTLRFALLTGMFAGLAFLSKYTGALLLPVLLSIMISSPTHRRCLKTAAPYLGLCLCVLFYLPVLIWNAQHGWCSVRYQFHHGVATTLHIHPSLFLLFLAGQFVVFGPLNLAALVMLCRQQVRQLNRHQRSLLWACALPWGGFLLASLFRAQHLHWAGVATISASILLASLIDLTQRIRLYRACLWVGLISAVGLKWLALIPDTPQAKLLDQEAVVPKLIKQLRTPIDPNALLISDNFRTAAMLEFYLPTHPSIWIPQYFFWSNQYRFWPPHTPTNSSVTYLGERSSLKQLKGFNCQTIQNVKFETLYNASTVHQFFVRAQCKLTSAMHP